LLEKHIHRMTTSKLYMDPAHVKLAENDNFSKQVHTGKSLRITHINSIPQCIRSYREPLLCERRKNNYFFLLPASNYQNAGFHERRSAPRKTRDRQDVHRPPSPFFATLIGYQPPHPNHRCPGEIRCRLPGSLACYHSLTNVHWYSI
jgi:hypothetical protein